MKLLLLGLITLLTLSAQAARVNLHGKTISEVLKASNCELRVINDPIIFAKNVGVTKVGNLFISAKKYSDASRKLPVSRTIKIDHANDKTIFFADLAVESIEVFFEGNYLKLNEITFDDLERHSDNTLTANCFEEILRDM